MFGSPEVVILVAWILISPWTPSRANEDALRTMSRAYKSTKSFCNVAGINEVMNDTGPKSGDGREDDRPSEVVVPFETSGQD